jgi:glycerate kinase
LLEGCTIVTSSTDRQAKTTPRHATRGAGISLPPSWRAARGTGISRRLLIACAPFGPRLSAAAAASAIALGLTEGGLPEPDVCPLPIAGAGSGRDDGGEEARAILEELGFDARMRRARAVVVGTALLEERTLAGSVTFEIATRARQAGVPAYAVTCDDALDAFDARILDLQVVLQARSSRGLVSAGRELAQLV